MNSAAHVVSKLNPLILGVQLPVGTQVINLSNTDTVRLSQSAGMSSGNGTPLDPLASMVMNKSGYLYAILDSDASGPVTLLVTDELNDYSNPVALAAAVASELLATGIPNVLVEETIIADDLIAFGGTKTYDVRQYASVVVRLTEVDTGVIYTFQDDLLHDMDSDYIVSRAAGLAVDLAVVGPLLKLHNISATAMHVTILGSNRNALNRYDARNFAQALEEWEDTKLWVAGTDYDLPLTTDNQQQGLVFADCHVAGNTVTGWLVLVDVNGTTLMITDTSEMRLVVGGTARRIQKLIAVPGTGYGIQFQCKGTGGTANVRVVLSPASI